ncbi:hypothetical protein DEU56DRAFT_900616 [Suillus clintonianus]|uniref:uncharacterized protein n=1 Tax=Suillus clintonianus TaxID=1904413 RepID=UPI001B869650|nr:uncharacterized protein DEU56DRAFT_900616 [Suillus clintonianus]KAG2141232.1 hypothetical protein DEU56DRAFT_900616 [Suillus clintonianus]
MSSHDMPPLLPRRRAILVLHPEREPLQHMRSGTTIESHSQQCCPPFFQAAAVGYIVIFSITAITSQVATIAIPGITGSSAHSIWCLIGAGLLFSFPMIYLRVKDTTVIEDEGLSSKSAKGSPSLPEPDRRFGSGFDKTPPRTGPNRTSAALNLGPKLRI